MMLDSASCRQQTASRYAAFAFACAIVTVMIILTGFPLGGGSGGKTALAMEASDNGAEADKPVVTVSTLIVEEQADLDAFARDEHSDLLVQPGITDAIANDHTG